MDLTKQRHKHIGGEARDGLYHSYLLTLPLTSAKCSGITFLDLRKLHAGVLLQPVLHNSNFLSGASLTFDVKHLQEHNTHA